MPGRRPLGLRNASGFLWWWWLRSARRDSRGWMSRKLSWRHLNAKLLSRVRCLLCEVWHTTVGLPGCLYRLPPPTHCWRRRIKFPISAFVYFYSVKLVLISGVTQEQDVTQSFLTQRLNYNDQHREKCDDVQVCSVICYCIEPDSHPTSHWCSSDTSYAKCESFPVFFVRNKTIGRGEFSFSASSHCNNPTPRPSPRAQSKFKSCYY